MSHKESKPKQSLPDLLEELFYPGESDEPLEYVEYSVDFNPPLTCGQVKDLLLIEPKIYVEEIPEAAFWEPVVTDQDWYEDEEKKRTGRFAELRHHVGQWLTDRQVFRIGESEVGLYLLGKKADGTWAGLKTRLVET